MRHLSQGEIALDCPVSDARFTEKRRGDLKFDIAAFFEPYVRQWLVNTDSKTEQWVQAVSVLCVTLLLLLKSRF